MGGGGPRELAKWDGGVSIRDLHALGMESTLSSFPPPHPKKSGHVNISGPPRFCLLFLAKLLLLATWVLNIFQIRDEEAVAWLLVLFLQSVHTFLVLTEGIEKGCVIWACEQ